jgi:RNA polymerase sigma factor (sigma-70 family)
MNRQSRNSKAKWIREALHRYERPLLRYAARITGSAETARDVVQETFLRLCEAKRDKVDDHLAAWLYTVARNHALNVRKKEARMHGIPQDQAEARVDSAAGPGAVALQSEAHERVNDALQGLPDKQQEACRLKFQDDLTYREISQVMGVSLGTVSSLITSALDSIRLQLRTGDNLVQEA